jgi:hypothetical protein
LTILDPQRLRLVERMPHTPPVPKVEMTASGDRYLTVVLGHLGGRHPQRFCLYSEQHATPRVPDEVTAAVAAFTADPAGEWARLVAEALDTEEQMVTEDLGARLRRISETRQRLLP